MIKTHTRTVVYVICDECGKDAKPGNTNGEAIEQAIDEGFWRVAFWNGECYSVNFYCLDCATQNETEIRGIKNVMLRYKDIEVIQ